MTSRAPILLVDDDEDMLRLCARWLVDEGHDVTTAASGVEGLGRLEAARPALVVTDFHMAGMDGMAFVAEVQRRDPLLPVVMLSGVAGVSDAVCAMHLGIAAFLTKPVQRERFLAEVAHALRLGAATPPTPFGPGLVHRSEAMRELLGQAELVARGDVTVLITGETGTGKELLAEAIHRAGRRAARPFVAVNCGAIPEQLLESELFGHERGAFTGATQRHEGLFRAADGGTLLLDEIGDMPLGLQVKLLRVLQDFEVRPVGATRAIPVNVRILAATHGDLEGAVTRGEFRADLYWRLCVVPLHIPPLRDRREDVPVLLQHFLERFARRAGTSRHRFAPEALDYLVAAPWPGNVRQLANVVELCATLCRTEVIPLALARRALRDQGGRMQTLEEAREGFERSYLVGVLRMTGGSVTTAARIAGRNRTEFYKLLARHGLDPAHYRQRGAGPGRMAGEATDDDPAGDGEE